MQQLLHQSLQVNDLVLQWKYRQKERKMEVLCGCLER